MKTTYPVFIAEVRKDHPCALCGGMIERGSPARRTVTNNASTKYRHVACPRKRTIERG